MVQKISLRIIFTYLFSLSVLSATLGQNKYAINRIHSDLLSNADAVVREHELEIHIISYNTVRILDHYAITILDSDGNDLANIVEPFSQINSIDSLQANLYDVDGKRVMSISKDEFATRILTSTGQRGYKYHQFKYAQSPFTIEITCITTQNNTFILPQWHPGLVPNTSIERATLEVTTAPGLHLRYYAKYLQVKKSSTPENNVTYQWILSNLQAHCKEDPSVLLALSRFGLGDHYGNMTTWNELGMFYYELNKGRDSLPDAIKRRVHMLTDAETDTIQKIRVLCKYLQSETKYDGYEDGLSGWQTVNAYTVATSHHADCKGMCNYMSALLREMGIISYPVHIKAGYGFKDIERTFPSQQFDHVILCIPLKRYKYWLDCTDPTTCDGTLNGYTNNRTGLMILNGGGQLVHVP